MPIWKENDICYDNSTKVIKNMKNSLYTYYLISFNRNRMPLEKPRVMIVLEDNDAITNLAGLLWLKGYEVYKATTAEECLSKINELGTQKVHVVIMSQQVALDGRAMLIVNVKRSNNETKILVLADEDTDKTKILDYGADEFTLKPISPENIADKLFMLLTREVVSENR